MHYKYFNSIKEINVVFSFNQSVFFPGYKFFNNVFFQLIPPITNAIGFLSLAFNAFKCLPSSVSGCSFNGGHWVWFSRNIFKTVWL
jgi:hypothetical protein